MKIGVLGTGSWGIALTKLLFSNGHDIYMWTKFEEEVKELNDLRESPKKLPGIKLDEKIKITSDMKEVVEGSDLIVMVVPSKGVRATAHELKKYIGNQIIVSAAKGIEDHTDYLMSQIIEEEIPGSKVVVLSGPTHAEEVAREIPTAIVAASSVNENASFVQDVFMNQYFRVYTSNDVVGVQLGAALKNIIALCVGILEGMGCGDNTKAAVITRGLAEIARLGSKLGANPITFYGLSGIGDLIVTSLSMHSRNMRAGILIGKGRTIIQAVEEVGMVVESVDTINGAYGMAKKYDVEMPIVEQAYEMIHNNKSPEEIIKQLMMRDKKSEC